MHIEQWVECTLNNESLQIKRPTEASNFSALSLSGLRVMRVIITNLIRSIRYHVWLGFLFTLSRIDKAVFSSGIDPNF